MKKRVLKFILLGIVFFISTSISAQVIAGEKITYKVNSTEAYVDSNHPSITMSFATPALGGETVTPVSNSDLFIRLSLGIWNYGHYHDIGYLAAQITSGSVPAGTELTLVSAPCTTTNSGGDLGTPTAPIILSTLEQPIVITMGDCYTGTGDTDGYQQTFTLEPLAGSFGQLVAGTYSVTVMFSLLVNQ